MNQPIDSGDDRLEILSSVVYFKKMKVSDLQQLLPLMRAVQYRKDDILIHENDPIDSIIIIVDGVAEIYTHDMKMLVATATNYDVLALTETGLFSRTSLRTATVKAATDIKAYEIAITDFQTILMNHQEQHDEILSEINLINRIALIKMSSPFASLPPEQLINLAKNIPSITLEPNVSFIKKGDVGDCCYLIEDGDVDVIDYDQNGNEIIVNTLNKGALIGELSIINISPRSKSIRTTTRATFLVISRDQFLETIQANVSATKDVMKLAIERSCPIKLECVEAVQSETDDIETFYILKNTKTLKYFRLTEIGWTIWNLLDGHHTVYDISEKIFTKHGIFMNDDITNLIGHLYADGFVQLSIGEKFQQLYEDQINQSISVREGIIIKLSKILEYRYIMTDVDPVMEKLYRHIQPIFFNSYSAAVMVIIVFVGLISFATIASTAISYGINVKPYLWLIVPVAIINIVMHELSHAMMLKYYNRSVNSVGVGWHWFTPVIFVDTSDMWLAQSRKKINVFMIGVFMDLVFISICSIIGLLVCTLDPVLSSFLWLYSLIGMIFIIFNLNPTIEFDGYYALSAVLKKPNLKKYSVLFLLSLFNGEKTSKHFYLYHYTEIAYWVITLLYIIFAPVLLYYISPIIIYDFLYISSYHQVWLYISWIIPLVFVVMSILSIVVDIHHYNEFTRNIKLPKK